MRVNIADKTASILGAGCSKGIAKLSYKGLSDEELVRAFVEDQDEEAFNEIVDRYGDKIYRTALRITHNPGDAEDVLQEVFIKLIEKLNSFHEESKFSTWLYRVALNASYMHLRNNRKKYERELGLEDYTPYNESGTLEEIKDWSNRADETLLSLEGMEIIEKAVNELSIAYRIVVHLRDVEELSNEETAKVMRLSVPAVKSRIHRARLFLRDKLSDYFHDGESKINCSMY